MIAAAGSEQAFAFLRKLIYDNSAIVLEADKRYLLEARLGPVLTRENLGTFDDLVARLNTGNAGALRQRVLEAITTHETSFFRDLHPFQLFRNTIVPRLLNDRASSKRLKIWCGAASTGQEPYTIAFIVKECGLQLAGWNVEIIATDLSEEILARAQTGRYNQLEVNRGLPGAMLARYFEKIGLEWQIKPGIREMVTFRKVNLKELWPPMFDLDVVFLRNVLIYFDVPTKKRIFDKLAGVMRRGGYLFLGAVESTHTLSDQFQVVQVGRATCYQRIS